MVVDDSPTALAHLKFALEHAGHAVTTRESAIGTVAEVMRTRPDVVVLDVSMPALDGDRLASVIAELRSGITIILHSSRDEAELQMLANAAGAHGYIRKTADFRAFIMSFERIVLDNGPPVSART